MNHYATFILLLMSVIATSCSDDRAWLEKMVSIQAAGDKNPVAALKALDSIRGDIQNRSKYLRMKYDLLETRLQDKAYIPATSDTKITSVTAYFAKKGSKAEQQEAYYYQGSVYRDLSDTPRALEAYLASLSISRQTAHPDSILLRNTYSNLCWLYYHVQDYNNALRMARMEYGLARKMKMLDAATVLHVGTSCIRLGQHEAARRYFRQAYRLATHEKTAGDDNTTLASLLYHCAVLGMRQEAEGGYRLMRGRTVGRAEKANWDLALGQYFMSTHQPDSAISRYRAVIAGTADLQGKYDASKLLVQIYKERGDLDRATAYADLFIRFSDTLNLGERQRLAATVGNKYRYHTNKTREEQTRQKAAFYRQLTLAVAAAATFVILVLVLLMLHRRNKRLQEIIASTNALISANRQVEKLKEEVRMRESEFTNLKSTLAGTKNRLKDVTAKIERYRHEVHEKEMLLEEKIKQNKSIIRLIRQSAFERKAGDVVREIRQSAEGKHVMSAAEWDDCYQAVNKLYPSFSDTLARRLGRIEEQELQVCYLMKMGLTNPQICNLTALPRTTVWRWTKKFEWITAAGN